MPSEKIIKTIRYLTYAIVILIPLIYFPTGIFPFQVIKTVVLQILAEIIFVLWLGLAIFYKEYRPRFTPIFSALIIFIIVVSLSSIFGVDWRTSLWSDEARALGLIGLLHFFALFLVLSSLREKINWRKLFFLSFGTAVLVSLIGISQKFFVLPKGSNPWLYILYSGIPERIGSTFSNSSFLAGYLLFNFFIGLHLFASRKPLINAMDYRSMFLIMGILLILVAIFLSQTIGAILGLGAGIFALLIYFSIFGSRSSEIQFKEVQPPRINNNVRRLNLQKFSIGLLILIVLFGVIFVTTRGSEIWQKIPGLSRIAQASFESESIRGRLITWQISLKAFREKPILGWGFENFRIAFNKYYDPKILTGSKSIGGSYWDKPHNILLEYLTTTGILGFLAYLGIFGAAFYLIFKEVRPPKIDGNNIGRSNLQKLEFNVSQPFLMAMLTAYFIQNLFIFDTIGTYMMFFIILAFLNSQFQEVRPPVVAKGNSPEGPINRQYLGGRTSSILTVLLLVLALVGVYYNYQIFNASRHEYWGINYFLNRLPESSLVSFSRAVATPTPYRDDIRKNFANVVKQAYQQNIQYPNLSELQGKLVEYLKLVISRHPKEFLNYISLAEFENVFYQYNPNYLKEAGELTQKALELSPERQQTYYVLAKTKILEGDVPAAYKIFERVVELNPQAGDPHFYFGLLAYGIGDSQKGASEIAEAERLGRGPQKIEESIALGNFVGDYEHDYKKAIKLYNSALLAVAQNLADKINRPNILLKLALAYYFDGNYEQSRQTFLELKKSIDLKQLPIYPELQPVLEELGIN